MKWSKEYDVYVDEIKEKVYKYAIENYIYDPIIGDVVLPEDYWFPEVLNVSDIERLLHSGIRELMDKKGLTEEIKKKGYDKFIIIPDVMSEKDVQLNYPYDHEYDMDRRNIIYMNDKLFELVDRKHLHSIKLNYNNKTYIFYKSGTEDGMINGVDSKLELLTFHEASFIDEDPSVPDYWDTDHKLILKFTKNRKIFINDEDPKDEYVATRILHPYMIYNYHEDSNNEEIIEKDRLKLYGLKTFNKDMEIVEKQFIHDPDRLLIHNVNYLFSTTAIIMFQDDTFLIENFKYPKYEMYIERFDKHTVSIKKDDNIKRIVIFLNPVGVSDESYKIDSMYNKVHKHSEKAYLLLKKHNKVTNPLLDLFINTRKEITIEDLIEYGYKYDKDVLKIIQYAIPTYIQIEKNPNNVFVTDDLKITGDKFFKPKIIVKVPNRIKGFPQLIINERVVCTDYKIVKRSTTDYIIIDPVRTFNVNPNDVNQNFLNNFINNSINTISVFFLTESYYDSELTNRRPYRILSDPKAHNRISMLNTYSGDGSNQSVIFSNGRLTYFKYFDDPSYELQYGVHRIPVFKNLRDENIEDYFKYKVTTPGAKDVGYTHDNKSINLLTEDGYYTSFFLDISKEANIRRSMMMLNLNSKSVYNYKVFDNSSHVNEEGFVNKVPQSEIKESIATNRTIFFDYDGLVIYPDILTEHHIDTNFLTLYKFRERNPNVDKENGGFRPRTNDTFCVHYLNIEPVNDKYGLDLRIDESRINKYFNSGSYNENVMKDPEIIRLFSSYPKESTKTPIGSYGNEYDSLMNMKLYSTFWYAYNGLNTLNQDAAYKEMVNSRNQLFTPNGEPVKQKIDTYFDPKETIKNYDSLYNSEVQNYVIAEIFKESDPFIANKELIDLNNKDYETNVKMDYYPKGKVILNSVFGISKH